ncbi:YbaK/EbsC family protein [Geomonas sp. Red69]|uniref:YbaK/EbsC family protein n=1 Tax=Geomonas diazotrophica TaxID=2843197 RepID=A0ABX8JPJ9_9BACT|nr:MULTISPECIES: YbaK/EbsC family protein [Geomonas]MBU5637327.1 YbaK/EbsC family protein [Geomonas diazotrophica]QWV99614.1 YbaK/EbsC family protein [Geomonas nitrogeniifigens]QXE84837.1 YbaK/EbsC family protein [Geomonas nitrogeniifigens]
MDSNLSASAKRVQDALNGFGIDCRVKEFGESTRTALDAANAVGCEVGQIVKSLVFRGKESGKAVFVVASGANMVNEKALAALVGEKIERATPDFVREQTGYAIGGVSPVGHPASLTTFIDEDLLGYQELWAAAGTPNAVFALTPEQLCHITAGQVAAIKK